MKSLGLRAQGWAGLAGALAGLALVTVHGQQAPTFSRANRTVAVYATVTDASGRLVPDLARDQFQIDDNGKRRS